MVDALSGKMAYTEQDKDERNDNTLEASRPAPDVAEAPYTIFDTRQKWLIVCIVSVAATCPCPPSLLSPSVIRN